MRPAKWLQETRLMRFEEVYESWTKKRLTQEEAAELLGVCEGKNLPKQIRPLHYKNEIVFG